MKLLKFNTIPTKHTMMPSGSVRVNCLLNQCCHQVLQASGASSMSEAASAASACLSKHAQRRVNVQRSPNFETGLLPHFMLFYCIKICGVANQPDCGKERFTGALCFNMFQLVSGPALRIANEIFALFSSGPTHLDKLAGAQIKNKIQKKI